MVAKSRAEIQKAYRERLKAKDNEAYLKKERERRKRNYVPTEFLSRRDKIRRNAAINLALKRHRKRKLQEKREAEALQQPQPEPMMIKMPFNQRGKGPRKRISRALGKKTLEVAKLQEQLKEVKKKYRTALRKIQRTNLQKTQFKKKTPLTPRSKTEEQMRQANLDKEQAKKIRRQILLGNVVMEEVKATKEHNKLGHSKILHNTLAGKIMKKYRCISLLSRKSGFARNSLSGTCSKSLAIEKVIRKRSILCYRDDVIEFLERDDNSRNLPGKADKVKIDKENTVQKRVLTDYISNLHQKFLGENPTAKISLTTFQRIRPKNILTTSFITRNSCLCTKHQNMAMLVKTLQQEGLDVSKNPEIVVSNYTVHEIEEKVNAEVEKNDITFSQWKRITIDDSGRKKTVTKIVEAKKSKAEFVAYLRDQFTVFTEHVKRMRKQYEEIRELKQNLPPHHAIIHMDFAENYSCKSMDEIQSAYWNQSFVTLHPAVVYTPGDSGICHTSYVYISDDLNHNSSALVTFIKDMVEEIKIKIDPNVECLHYWTDSPTSQYRNKTIFQLIANHEKLFGIKAKWNYFEAGHGKGPCDGIGGCTKRMADQAMKSGKAVIQDAKDFFGWTQSENCNLKNINFKFVPKEQCENTATEIQQWINRPIKGTMKIHAVVGLGNNAILVKETSCYCQSCLAGNMCDSWRRDMCGPIEAEVAENNREETEMQTDTVNEREMCGPIEAEVAENNREETEMQTDTVNEREMCGPIEAEMAENNREETEMQPDTVNERYDIGTYVAALYEGKTYIGKVTDLDPEDDLCYKINFLEQKKKQFQWPRNPDEIWCRKQDVLFKVQEPTPSGKSNRLLKLLPEDRNKVDNVFDSL